MAGKKGMQTYNWFGDRGTGAAPPEFQCEKWVKLLGRRCRQWRMKGKRFCRKHNKRSTLSNRVRIHHLPRFYSKVLSGTLREFVEECCSMEPHEQLALWEELALLRDHASTYVKLYDLCKSLPEETKEQRDSKLAKLQESGELMRLAINQVAELAAKQANIVNSGKDKVTVHNIEYAVRQVVRIAYEVFGEDSKAKEFEAMVREYVKVSAGNEGTTITPDQEALALDSTVPRSPDDEAVS